MTPKPILKSTPPSAADDSDTDPVLERFLGFLAKEITARPTLIEPVDRVQLKRIGEPVAGVTTGQGN